ncbi:MAG: alpha/beta hydrolase [bacterium]|nr:alpha/beta hydrolase [bacterium]
MFRKILLSLLAAIGLSYAALNAYVYSIQDQLTYHPIRRHAYAPADYGLSVQEHRVPTPTGERLHAWYLPAAEESPDESSSFVLLYSHGNAGNLSHNLRSLRQLHQLGISVFIYDYRGYGESTGIPDEAGLYADAHAALDYLRNTLKIPAERVLYFGRSLGGAMAVDLAARRPARALILESTFTSAVDVGAEVYWFLPVSLLARNRFESLERLRTHALKDVNGEDLPVLIIHGRQDRLVPFAHAERLHAAARTKRKTLLEIQGGHNDAFLVSKKRYEAAFADFLKDLKR